MSTAASEGQNGSAEAEERPARPSIPLVVHAGASLLSALAVVVALLVGLASAIIEGELEAFGLGPAVGSMLLGQGLGFETGIRFGPGLSATVGFVPFGIIVPAAFVLRRIGFTAAWLKVRSARLLPAAAGGLVAVFVSLLLTLPDEGGFGTRFFAVAADSTFRPGWAFVAGAAPWLLAVLLANNAIAAAILRGLVALQGLVVLGVFGLIIVEGLDAGAPFLGLLGFALFFAVATLAISINLVTMVLAVPLGGAIGVRFGDFSESVGLITLLQEDPSTPVLWTGVLLSVAGIALLAWRDGPSSDFPVALLRIRNILIATTAVILPMLVLGRLYGDFGAELGLLDPFVGRSGSGSFSASVGSSGQPLRWLIIAPVMALLLLITQVILARTAGLSWASNDSLSARGQDIARTTSGTLRGAAERAKRAAEAARAAAETASPPSQSAGEEQPPSPAPTEAPSPTEQQRPEAEH